MDFKKIWRNAGDLDILYATSQAIQYLWKKIVGEDFQRTKHNFHKDQLLNSKLVRNYEQKIDLVKLAKNNGYTLDTSKSSQQLAVLKKEQETILISRDKSGKHYYFNPKNKKDNGTALDFVSKFSYTPDEALMALRRYLEYPVDNTSLKTHPEGDSRRQALHSYSNTLEKSIEKQQAAKVNSQKLKASEKIELLEKIEQAQNSLLPDTFIKGALQKLDLVGYAVSKGYQINRQLSTPDLVILDYFPNIEKIAALGKDHPMAKIHSIAVCKNASGDFAYYANDGSYKGSILEFDDSRTRHGEKGITPLLRQCAIDNAIASQQFANQPVKFIQWQDKRREQLISEVQALFKDNRQLIQPRHNEPSEAEINEKFLRASQSRIEFLDLADFLQKQGYQLQHGSDNRIALLNKGEHRLAVYRNEEGRYMARDLIAWETKSINELTGGKKPELAQFSAKHSLIKSSKDSIETSIGIALEKMMSKSQQTTKALGV